MKMTLAEIFRPTELEDLMQPMHMIERFRQMVKEQHFVNMLFYGQPGVGKTSAARLMFAKTEANVCELNGSKETGIDKIRDLEHFVVSMSIYPGPKVCFIDECEFLSLNAQAGLRGLIEQDRKYTRFIMTANDINKLHPALKSRCYPICFDPAPQHADEIIARLLPRYKEKIVAAGYQIPDSKLSEIVHTEFPDLRRVANSIEFEATPLPKPKEVFQLEQA